MKTEFPRNIIFFDTETLEKKGEDETELKLHMGVACFWRAAYKEHTEQVEWFSFRTRKQFWDWVETRTSDKQKLYMVAHNVGFDVRVLDAFGFFRANHYEAHKVIFESTMSILEFRSENKTICILDNMNYFKSSLAKLGESIGVPKMDMPLTTDLIALESYCRNDVYVMLRAWQVWMSFIKDNDLGNFAKTIASQSMNTYRHRFMKTPIHIHTNQDVIDMERESYHGGRTEAFYIGKMPKRDYYLVDVNSMYPSVMINEDYPYKLESIQHHESPDTLRGKLETQCAVSKVLLDVDEPVFPVKHKGRLIFPTGIFETTLTSRELMYALDNGYLMRVIKTAYYSKANLFEEYVKFFYEKKSQYKEEKNEAFEYLCKLFLNSLYGKFGQRNDYYEKVDTDTLQPNMSMSYFDMDKDKHVKERRINGVLERSEGKVEGFDSMVSIASHITADARMKLWEYFKVADRNNVFYTDTDSMIVNGYGYKRIQVANKLSKKLGELSLKQTNNILEIRGAKDYTFGDNEVIKGIRKDAEKITDSHYRQIRFEGMNGALRSGRLDKVFISFIDKELSRNYTKGIVMKNGKVEPFVLKYQQSLL